MKQAKFEADGKKYEVAYDCPDDEIKNQINEIFSDKEYKLARRKKNMVVLDVGANVGMFDIYIKDWAKKIYAVEPSKRCFDCLKVNTKDWDNIEIFNTGFLNRIGKRYIYGNGDETPQNMMMEGEHKELVDITTIEDFMTKNKIAHVDVMKIDTEGAEYVILADQSFLNVAPKIDFIIGETHYMNRALPEHVLMMLEKAGFKAKLLPFENQFIWLSYENEETGQKARFQVDKPTMFVAERIK